MQLLIEDNAGKTNVQPDKMNAIQSIQHFEVLFDCLLARLAAVPTVLELKT